MKILFVGNEDLAGKYLAERFYKEGHKLFLLTEKEHSFLCEGKIKINVYKSALTSHRCKNIFKGSSIDAVIFMTGEYRDALTGNASYNYRSMIPDLMNILRISFESRVKQFIFLSSTELDGRKPFTPILSDLQFGEELCKSWEKNYNIPLLILRISSIYGVGPYELMGRTGTIIKRMIEKEHITIELNRLSRLDLVSGEDAADAVYRAVMEKELGMCRISSGKAVTLEDYVSQIAEVYQFKEEIKFSPSKPIQDSINAEFRDNHLSTELGWAPMHEFMEDGSQILKMAKQLNEDRRKKREKEKENQNKKTAKVKKFQSILKPFVENVLLFILSCLLLQFTKESTDFRFVDVRLVHVVIVSSIYGLKQGLAATILAWLSYGYSIAHSGVDISYLVYSIDTWTPFILYLIVGSGVGYASDKKTDDRETVLDENHILSEKYDFLKEIYQEVCEVKEQLQRQIIVSNDSFGRVYDITRELDSFQPELIFFKAVNILEDIMECKEVCIYTVNHEFLQYARLMANSSELAGTMEGTLNLNEMPEMKHCLEQNEVFVNKNLLENYPSYAAPIMDDNKIVAVAVIYKVDFEKFTAYYKNLFEIIVGMIQNNLVRAYRYSSDVSEKRYLEGSEILRPMEFREQLNIMKDAKESTKIFYLMMQVKPKNSSKMDFAEFAAKVKKLLRSTDFIGCDDEGIYHIVFMQTKTEHVELLKNRFDNAGLILIGEDEIHD